MEFELFGTLHGIIFACIGVCSIGFIFLGRRFPHTRPTLNLTLAGILLLTKFVTLLTAWHTNQLTLQNGLPMHLCDWATIIVMIVLIWPKQGLYEIAYFWGLAGTAQALFTPDLKYFFPDIRFITFFVSHGGIIVAVLYLTFGLRQRPTTFSILKAAAATQLYIAATLFVNHLTNSNYGYLSAKPQNPSLLDYLGEWPYYILAMDGLALVFFLILYAPFTTGDWVRKKNAKGAPSSTPARK